MKLLLSTLAIFVATVIFGYASLWYKVSILEHEAEQQLILKEKEDSSVEVIEKVKTIDKIQEDSIINQINKISGDKPLADKKSKELSELIEKS